MLTISELARIFDVYTIREKRLVALKTNTHIVFISQGARSTIILLFSSLSPSLVSHLRRIMHVLAATSISSLKSQRSTRCGEREREKKKHRPWDVAAMQIFPANVVGDLHTQLCARGRLVSTRRRDSPARSPHIHSAFIDAFSLSTGVPSR